MKKPRFFFLISHGKFSPTCKKESSKFSMMYGQCMSLFKYWGSN